jgi:hypothetical protein
MATETTERVTIEALLEGIDALVACRQELRVAGASRDELERNRLEIAAAQQQLSSALIERYAPSPHAA